MRLAAMGIARRPSWFLSLRRNSAATWSLFAGVGAVAGFIGPQDSKLAVGAMLAIVACIGLYRRPEIVPAVLLAAPPYLHVVLQYAGFAGSRGDVLASPLTFAPVLAIMFGIPVIAVIGRTGRLLPTWMETQGRHRTRLLFWMLVLEYVFAVRIYGSLAPTYGLTKTLGFLAFSILPVCLILLAVDSVERLDSFWSLSQAVGMSYLLITLVLNARAGDFNLYVGDAAGNAGLVGDDAIPRAAAIVLLVSSVMFLRRVGPASRAAAGVLLGGSALLLSGSRGTIVAVAAALIVLFTANRVFRALGGRRAGRSTVIAVAALAIAFIASLSVAPADVTQRFDDPLQSVSFQGRVGAQKAALEGFYNSKLIGKGTGASAYLIAGVDQSAFGVIQGLYPHNVIIELASETGLVGLVPYLIAIIGLLVSAARRDRARHWGILCGVVLVTEAFVNSQAGSDVTISNDLWMMAALLAIGCDLLGSDPGGEMPVAQTEITAAPV